MELENGKAERKKKKMANQKREKSQTDRRKPNAWEIQDAGARLRYGIFSSCVGKARTRAGQQRENRWKTTSRDFVFFFLMWTTRVILWIRKADKKALLELHFSKNRKYLFCLSEVMRWRKHVQCHCIGICERFIIQRLRCEFLPSFCRSTTYVQINTKWFVNFLLCRSQQELWTLWTQTRTTEIHIYIIRSSEFVLLVVCGRISEQILWRKNRFSSCLNATDRGNAPSAPAHFTELFICSCNLMKRKIDRTKHLQHYYSYCRVELSYYALWWRNVRPRKQMRRNLGIGIEV